MRGSKAIPPAQHSALQTQPESPEVPAIRSTHQTHRHRPKIFSKKQPAASTPPLHPHGSRFENRPEPDPKARRETRNSVRPEHPQVKNSLRPESDRYILQKNPPIPVLKRSGS